jgi:hypothetical protein
LAISKNNVIFTSVSVAAVLSIGIYYLAPDSGQTGAVISEDVLSGQSEFLADETEPGSLDSLILGDQRDEENDGSKADKNNELISDADSTEFVPAPIGSFEAHMAVPGAKAETYVLDGDAFQTNRLVELKEPEDFDAFAAALEQNADPDSYEKASEYMQLFNAAISDSSSSIAVSLVSCGGIVCVAKLQSQDTAEIEKYLQQMWKSKSVPMYAATVMPPEANGGYDIRRLVFTNDPSAAAFVGYVDQ